MITLFLLVNALIYFLLMRWYRRGLYLLENGQPATGSETGISVVVAARNEEKRLPALLKAMKQQLSDGFDFELILVNDGSQDLTAAVMSAAATVDSSITLLETSSASRGKKAAITLGVENARYPLIALCDADSVPQPEWLTTLYHAFTPRTGMVLGVTRLEAEDTLFSRIIQIEYAGILSIGLATAALGIPLFASGSNLAFRKQCFQDAGGYRDLEDIPSGDDTLLIQRVNRRTDWEIVPLINPRGQVHSRAPRNFRQLLSQRARWSSTHLRLPDFRLTLIGANTYLLVSSILVTLLCSLSEPVWMFTAIALLLIKMLAETGFLLHGNRLQGLKVSWQQILVGQFWELLYIPLSPLLGLTGLFHWRRK